MRLGLHWRVLVVINQLIMKCTPTTNFSGSKRFVVRAHKQFGVSLVLVIPHTRSWPTLDGTTSTTGESLGAPTVAAAIITLLRIRPMSLTPQDRLGSLGTASADRFDAHFLLNGSFQRMVPHFHGHPRRELLVRPASPRHFP